MLGRTGAREFEHVEGADEIGIDIGARIFEAVAHAGLRREMDDDVGLELLVDAAADRPCPPA